MARGGFAATAAARYVPHVGVYATRECDTVVRMSDSPHDSLHDAFVSANNGALMRLATPAELGPHVWLEASMALDSTLGSCSSSDSPAKLLDAYTAALEAATANVEHEFLAQPLLSVLGVWVGEQDLLSHLDGVSPNMQFGVSPGASPAPGNVTERPAHSVVVLVARAGSRQDDAALLDAKAAVSARVPVESVFVLRLGDGVSLDDPESLPNAVAALGESTRTALNGRIKDVSAEADKVRRAVRPTFRSWFGATSGPRQPSLAPSGSSRMSFGGGIAAKSSASEASGTSDTSQTPLVTASSSSSSTTNVVSMRGPLPGGRHRRRTSSMNGVISTPLYNADSLESLSRHAADLLMLSGDFEAAGDAYRVLFADVSGQSGAACVHEASAIEHASVALALADGSKREVGSGLERAVKLYARAGRRELAVRAALRAAEYCMDAGFPDSAAGVLDRALSVTFPSASVTRVSSGGSFSESGAAMLLARTAIMFVLMGRRRKASLYAYLAASKLSNQTLHAAAGVIARDVDETALGWLGVADEINLFSGRAALSEGSIDRAMVHFSNVMSQAKESTDVEVQSRAIMGFFDAASRGDATSGTRRRWDSGVPFPISDTSKARTVSVDSKQRVIVEKSRPEDGRVVISAGAQHTKESGVSESEMRDSASSWRALEDELLRDCAHFKNVFAARKAGIRAPKRARSFQSIAEDMRKEKENGSVADPGGSLETKIQRMQEAAMAEIRRLRAQSLLDTGAVVGETISLFLTLRNPLQFPVFLEAVSPVVALNGSSFSANGQEDGSEQNGCVPCITIGSIGDVLIMPSSSKVVKLEVVSRSVGDLRFIGAQWLFSVGRSASRNNGSAMAAGFCMLDRRGHRLNHTREQRASEVPLYAEDEVLKLDVIPPAARLQIRFDNKSSANGAPSTEGLDDCGSDEEDAIGIRADLMRLRAGQKLRSELAITNVGQHPVESIVYRTGTPHAFYLDTVTGDDYEPVVEEGERRNATISKNVAGCISLSLQPGETVNKPVWLFGAAGGETEIKLAIGYGERIRVCRLVCKLAVLPSVNVFPRFIRRMCAPAAEKLHQPESFLLGVEVEHAGKYNGDDSYQVESAAVASTTGWTVKRLPNPVVPDGSESSTRKVNRSSLRINETSTIFLVVSRPAVTPSNAVATALQTSSVLFCSSEDEKNQSDEKCFKESSARASAHFSLTSGHAERLGSTAETAIHVSVKWRSSSGSIGELYLAPLDPSDWVEDGEKSTMLEAKTEETRLGGSLEGTNLSDTTAAENLSAENLPVQIRVVHRKHMSHRFLCSTETDLVCVPAVVPVDLYVRNVSDVLIDTSVSAPVAGGIADGDRGRFWAGSVDVTLRAIPPGIERRVCLSAILDSPGTYDLSKLVTSVHRHSGLMPVVEKVSVSRSLSREVRVHEVMASSIVVEELPGATALSALQPRGPPMEIAATSVVRKKLSPSLDSAWDDGDSDE